jgi:hypothetical protein
MSDAPLTGKHLQALQATARGEVFRTYNSSEFTITGPCGSKLLWSLARAGLIADHRVVLWWAAIAWCSPPRGWQHWDWRIRTTQNLTSTAADAGGLSSRGCRATASTATIRRVPAIDDYQP